MHPEFMENLINGQPYAPSDDAASSPHESNPSVVELPVVDLGCLPHEHESLGIGHDLRGIESLSNVLNEFLLVSRVLGDGGSGEVLGGLDTLVLERGETTGKHRLT